jgi:hypothetical protein
LPKTEKRVHYTAYTFFKRKIQEHIDNKVIPILTETGHPLGGVNWNLISNALKRVMREETVTNSGVTGIQEKPLDIVNTEEN